MTKGIKLTISESAMNDLIKIYEEVDNRKYSKEEIEDLKHKWREVNKRRGLGTLY